MHTFNTADSYARHFVRLRMFAHRMRELVTCYAYSIHSMPYQFRFGTAAEASETAAVTQMRAKTSINTSISFIVNKQCLVFR